MCWVCKETQTKWISDSVQCDHFVSATDEFQGPWGMKNSEERVYESCVLHGVRKFQLSLDVVTLRSGVSRPRLESHCIAVFRAVCLLPATCCSTPRGLAETFLMEHFEGFTCISVLHPRRGSNGVKRNFFPLSCRICNISFWNDVFRVMYCNLCSCESVVKWTMK
jgi:hypothetical protein